MGEWPVCSPATTSFLTQSCKSTEGTGQRCLLVITRPSTVFQTRPRWDARCNSSLSVAVGSITGIYFTHLRVLGADKNQEQDDANSRHKLGRYHLMPGNYSELFWRGKVTYPDENSRKLKKRLRLNTWLRLHSDPTCLIAQTSLLHNTPGKTWQEGVYPNRKKKKEHMTISNQVQKNPGKTCFHACETPEK